MSTAAPLPCRARLRERQCCFGAWMSIGHLSIAEMFAAMGVDFLAIDMEHSVISLAQAQAAIAAAQGQGVSGLVRLSSHNAEQARRLLDAGADGVIVPNVTSPTQVGRIVEWCKYPPAGRRGYGVARAHGYGAGFDAYVATWNDRSTILLQIESIDGVGAIDDLLAHEAIDGVMVGPYDLSGSLKVPGELSHPKVTDACAQVIAACRNAGKACGTHLVDPTPENVRAALAAGYTFLVLASDVFILWKWGERMRALMEALRAPGEDAAPRRSARRRRVARVGR